MMHCPAADRCAAQVRLARDRLRARPRRVGCLLVGPGAVWQVKGGRRGALKLLGGRMHAGGPRHAYCVLVRGSGLDSAHNWYDAGYLPVGMSRRRRGSAGACPPLYQASCS